MNDLTTELTDMLGNCIENGLTEWDQVVVDRYNKIQGDRGGVTIGIGHTADEALQIVRINSL